MTLAVFVLCAAIVVGIGGGAALALLGRWRRWW